MGLQRRLRARPVSIETINRHNNFTPITWPELQAENARKKGRRGKPIYDMEYYDAMGDN